MRTLAGAVIGVLFAAGVWIAIAGWRGVEQRSAPRRSVSWDQLWWRGALVIGAAVAGWALTGWPAAGVIAAGVAAVGSGAAVVATPPSPAMGCAQTDALTVKQPTNAPKKSPRLIARPFTANGLAMR